MFETTEQTIERVRALNEPRLRQLSEAVGIPVPTLEKIRYGVTLNPRGKTLDKLRHYFSGTRMDS